MKKMAKAMAVLMVAAPMVMAPAQAMAANKYSALGDSIAFGVGASFLYGYTLMYANDFLYYKYGGIDFKQWSVPGHKSGDMLNQIRTYPTMRTDIKGSTDLTVSIGGNNLLGCASSNYSVIDTACAERGVQNFAADWPQILSEIRSSIGAAGKLTVMTLYNPYRGDEALYATVDPYVKRINAVISNTTTKTAYNYRVADVYSSFLGKFADGSWKVSKYTLFSKATRDPHPSTDGHREIARLHQLLY